MASSRSKETVLIATDDKKALKKSFHMDRSKKLGKDLQEPRNVKSVSSPSMKLACKHNIENIKKLEFMQWQIF